MLQGVCHSKKLGDPDLESYLCELAVEQHLFGQHRLVVEEVWLHVTPHVGEPPELLTVGQKQVISKILLICA